MGGKRGVSLLNWLWPWLLIPINTLQPLLDFLKGNKNPSSPGIFTSKAKQVLCKIKELPLALYTQDRSGQLLTLLEALYQSQGVLERLCLPISHSPRLLREFGALSSLIKLGRNKALQTLGRVFKWKIHSTPWHPYSQSLECLV